MYKLFDHCPNCFEGIYIDPKNGVYPSTVTCPKCGNDLKCNIEIYHELHFSIPEDEDS